MLHRAFGLLVLVSACTRVSSPGSTEVAPIASECKSTELAICVESCQDAACLQWCAGESCAAAIASLSSCTDEALAVSSERWVERCQPICAAQVVPPREGPSFCDDWRASYFALARLSGSAPEQDADASTSPTLDGVVLATSMWLVGEVSRRYDDPHAAALRHMIDRGRWRLGDVESCVPDLDAKGREFFIVLEVDESGAVQATSVRGDPTYGECVAHAVADALTLPARVVRDYPQIELRVLVVPLPELDN